MMDLQTCLKTSLRNKYQKLKNSTKSLLPPRLCFRRLREDYSLPNLHQHEFRYVDNSDLHTWIVYPPVTLTDVLTCVCKHNSSKRTVITLGVSGVGKTTVVQQCALAWAEDKRYHHIRFLLPLTFWELNLIKHKLSLIELLQKFYPELKELDASSLNKSNVWFVLDGLDEYQFPLNFSGPTVTDVSKASSVSALVTNLIKGNLLPKAHIWLLTRYSAATQIPNLHLLKETEVQGFSDEQKDQHFRAIVGDDDLTNKVLNHVKISRSLDFLCQIPPICTIMANVLMEHVKPNEGFKINPLSLTQIYTHLVKASNSETIAKLKKLAQIWWITGSNVIHVDDLLEGDISAEEASTFSKENPLLLREETGLNNTRVFRFGHSSIQEYLAASARLDDIEASEASLRSGCYQRLVDDALRNEEGKNDTYLRFIFGLIRERRVLEPNDKLFVHIKNKILENILSYCAVGLFHCLREYDPQALLNEVKFFQKHGYGPIQFEFTPMHWKFMIQRAMNFEGQRGNFELQVPARCDKNLIRHLPAIQKSKKAMLRFSNLTDQCCPALAAVLSTPESYLRELDLGYNSISNVGVYELVEGLADKTCKLQTLRLQGCGVTPEACQDLCSALLLSQNLKYLDLSMNEIGDEGMSYLSDGLCDAALQTLKLSQCNIEQEGCRVLASCLQWNPHNLKELDLSINMVGDEGANELFSKFNISQLTKLEMYHCGLTELSCENIGKALRAGSSTLVELNLSNNDLKDAGFEEICLGMSPYCGLERLNVSRCGITAAGCIWLGKALSKHSSLFTQWQIPQRQAVQLKDLDLSMNCLGDEGVKRIARGLKNPYGCLNTLNLSHCGLTEDCCTELASGLASQENVLSFLDLSGNDLQDKGVERLCEALRNPQCELQKLSLRTCGLTSRGGYFLVSALKSNPKHLAELQLMGNKLEDSDIRVLAELTKKQKYALRTIDVSAD